MGCIWLFDCSLKFSLDEASICTPSYATSTVEIRLVVICEVKGYGQETCFMIFFSVDLWIVFTHFVGVRFVRRVKRPVAWEWKDVKHHRLSPAPWGWRSIEALYERIWQEVTSVAAAGWKNTRWGAARFSDEWCFTFLPRIFQSGFCYNCKGNGWVRSCNGCPLYSRVLCVSLFKLCKQVKWACICTSFPSHRHSITLEKVQGEVGLNSFLESENITMLWLCQQYKLVAGAVEASIWLSVSLWKYFAHWQWFF